MFTALLTIQIVLCLLLIGAVMLQQGKGADLGAALGGNSASVFGAAGANNLLVKVTVVIAVLFMVSSVFLIRAFQERRTLGLGVVSAPNALQGSVTEELAAAQAEAQKNVVELVPSPVATVVGAPASSESSNSGSSNAPSEAASKGVTEVPAAATN